MFKKLLFIGTIGASLFLGSHYYYLSPLHSGINHAVAVVIPTKGNMARGVVKFTEQSDGIAISTKIIGLTPGEHGFHIHEFGNCACDDAVCTGDHFNPTNQPHGGPDSAQRHVGDLGNLVADAQGNATYERVDTQIKLNGPHSIVGRAVIIHAKKDDFVSQPTGNAGARIGAGVVGIAKK
jgi:Cu-Zn family superoxide dismutase